MKTHLIENILKERGGEKGVLYVLQTLSEEANDTKRTVTELAKMLEAMIDTLQNITNGSLAMRAEMIQTLRRNGISVDAEDGLGPNTLAIGEKQ